MMASKKRVAALTGDLRMLQERARRLSEPDDGITSADILVARRLCDGLNAANVDAFVAHVVRCGLPLNGPGFVKAARAWEQSVHE
jgi:hypothetical protein